MKRKTAVRAAAFLAALFLVTGGLAFQQYRRAEGYRQSLQLGYQHAFAELTTNLGELNAALQKGIYSSSPAMLGTLCTQIYGKAMAAQLALGELPFSNVELEQTAAFVAKTGDYVMALSQLTARTGTVSDEQRESLRGLADGAASLTATLEALQADLYAGSFSLEEVAVAEHRLSAATEDGDQVEGGSSFQTIESDFPEMPTLIYDGPFSEHIAGQTPKFLADRPEVREDEARAAAAAFLDLRPDLFSLTNTLDGNLPAYGFTATVDGGELYIEVTRQGGQILSLFHYRPVSQATLSKDEAVALAGEFLAARGFSDMEHSYTIDFGNVLSVNFSPRVYGVYCYTDLIRVSVALDNGRIVGLESKGYLMNHTARDEAALTPAVGSEQARTRVSPDLEVLSHQLALIPTGGAYEVLTHEFKCETFDGSHIIVYVNALTGDEEKILLLLEDESGTLTL